jgi:hypothetical protein
MRAVDTNVLVRLVTRDDVKQVAIAEAVANGAWVPTSPSPRRHGFLQRSTIGAEAIATAVEMLLNHQH